MPKVKSNYDHLIKFRASKEFLQLMEEGKDSLGGRLVGLSIIDICSDLDLTSPEEVKEAKAKIEFSRSSLIKLKASDFYRLIILKWAFENVPECVSSDIPELVDLKELIRLIMDKQQQE